MYLTLILIDYINLPCLAKVISFQIQTQKLFQPVPTTQVSEILQFSRKLKLKGRGFFFSDSKF